MTFSSTWAAGYYEDGLPDGTYRGVPKSFKFKTTSNGKELIELKATCIDGEYQDAPLGLGVWYTEDFGEKQLKGIIRRVLQAQDPDRKLTPMSHLEAGTDINQIQAWLEQHLVGSICEFRVETKISQKDGKEYTNTWFHSVLEPNRPQPTLQAVQGGLQQTSLVNPEANTVADIPF